MTVQRRSLLWRFAGQKRQQISQLFLAQILKPFGHQRNLRRPKLLDLGPRNLRGFVGAFGDDQVVALLADQARDGVTAGGGDDVVDVIGIDAKRRLEDVLEDGFGIDVNEVGEVGAEDAALAVEGVAGGALSLAKEE